MPSSEAWWRLAGVMFAVFRLVPWSPQRVGIGLDLSWGWATHEAWLRGLQQGTEFVLTTGPLGFVATQIFVPSTFGLMLAIHAGLACVMGGSLWWIRHFSHGCPLLSQRERSWMLSPTRLNP